MENPLVKTKNEIAEKMVNSLQKRILGSSLGRSPRGKAILLLDTSSSMYERIEGDMRRIDALKLALSELCSGNLPTFQFNNSVSQVEDNEELIPQGDTRLEKALEEMKRHNPEHLIIITDGEPTFPERTLEIASEMSCKINTIFVGDPHNYEAINFCKLLASQNKGQFASNPLEARTLSLLPETIKLMLPSAEQDKPIAL